MTTQFYGFCSYPHGGWAIVGLGVSCICALAATMWGMASCRFMYIDYITDRGDFSDFYRDPTADGEPVLQRVGAGLFTWLVPFTVTATSSNGSWTEGQCAGYSEGQRNFFSDTIFEVSRIFAVLSVLGGMGVVVAVLFLSCMTLRRFQIWMFTTILGLISMSNLLTFIVFQSKICNDLVSYQQSTNDDEMYTTTCTMDQGGLIVIAAAIFWAVACLISIVYIKDPKRDLGIKNGQITNVFESRQEQRYQRENERQMKHQMNRERRKQQQLDKRRAKEPSSSSSSPSSNKTNNTNSEEGEV